jgi:hypothetical protein
MRRLCHVYVTSCKPQWPALATLGAVANQKRSDGNLTTVELKVSGCFALSFPLGGTPPVLSYEYETMRVTGKAVRESMETKGGRSMGPGIVLCDEATIRLEQRVEEWKAAGRAGARRHGQFGRTGRLSLTTYDSTSYSLCQVLLMCYLFERPLRTSLHLM